jgi:predicted transposase YbfD/YdcC
MNQQAAAAIQEHFSDLVDPRRKEPIYPLTNIVVMTLCAVICGCDDFVSIARYAVAKKEWFATFLDVSMGIPSHDRFNAVFRAMRPEMFEKCLLNWVTALHKVTAGQVIAIDGKTLRGSYDKANAKAAIHMVSAWATLNHISLGQVVTDAKSNEITAIPKLLELIDISGALVTIDAMGCQVEIADRIIEGKGDYCLAVKGNQPTLHEGIENHFMPLFETDFEGAAVGRHVDHDAEHGREVDRFCYICPVPENLPDQDRWRELKAIGAVVTSSIRNAKETCEVRYYILSRHLTPAEFASTVRRHWGVENNLHWQLDVTFREDQCRLRKDHADANFSILRRTALSLLKHERTEKVGMQTKRMICGWNEDYLIKVLCNQ